MTKLEELLNEYCPDGVEYKPLGEVCIIEKGKQFNKADMFETGTYPVINGGINPSGYIEQFNCNGNTITISQGGASAGYVNWMETKFWQGAHCYSVKPLECVENRYLYHFIKSKEITLQQCQFGAGIPALNKADIAKLQVPVPPLVAQREIVRILDNFTLYLHELTAELTARRKQYEFYRDALLTFDKNVQRGGANSPVQWKKLGEVASIYDGTHQTPKYQSCGVRFVSVENILNPYESKKYISETDFNKYKIKPKTNDILMTRIGSIGVCTVLVSNEPLAYYVSLALIRPNLECVASKFLKYLLESRIGRRELAKRTLVNAVPIKINKEEIGKIQIPIPPLAEQERIVTILDKFDALCNDITTGLPAEIERRQKQYEYYRDKLLTFKKRA